MKLKKLPLIAVSAILSFVACSDDSGTGAELNTQEPISALTPADSNVVATDSLGNQVSLNNGNQDPGNQLPEGQVPGGEVLDNQVPGNEISSSSVVTGNDISSSSNMFPVSSAAVVPGGDESGDDENDNEDARTLNGTQILLKLAGTSATVENNNGCVEVEDKSATITCPGAYYVTGEASDFQVVVNTPAADK